MENRRSDGALYALILGFALLSASIVSSIVLAAQQRQSFAQVQHTLLVEKRVTGVLSRLQDAETGQRGYLLTGRSEFLEPYDAALAHLGEDLASLRASLADAPAERPRLERLQAIAEARQGLLQDTIARYRTSRAVDVATLSRGKRLMDDARDEVAAILADQDRLLAARTETSRLQAAFTTTGLVLSAIATLALGVFVVVDNRRRLGAALDAGAALAAANDRLAREAEEREAAEAQVRQLQKMEAIGQLTGGVAHDFNNMLAVIIGSLDLAKRRLASEADRAGEFIDNALEGAQRAAQLTGRLLAFSRQQALDPRPTDVNKLVGGMSELLRRTIGENLKVETILAGGLWRTSVDPAQLESAILNLCVNARDAMPDGGRLTIETANAHLDDGYAAENPGAQAGQFVMVTVSDTGMGMPPELLERVFEPFFTTKGVGRGTGLGLSQVQGFVRQSGGHVKIYSEPGVGTTVKIYLQRYFGAETAVERDRPSGADLPRGSADEIILVVEDDAKVRHVSVDALRELGYTVVQAADVAQALSVLTVQPRVDLLFTDVVMPDASGRVLADQVRERWSSVKVLFTTGYTRNAIVHNGVLDPGVELLGKPFTIEQLAHKVRAVLDAV